MSGGLNTRDLSRTVVEYVVRESKGDAKKAQDYINELVDPGKEEEKSRTRKIAELAASFPSLNSFSAPHRFERSHCRYCREPQQNAAKGDCPATAGGNIIRVVLANCDWDVEAAIEPLFEMVHEQSLREAKERRDRENAAQAKERKDREEQDRLALRDRTLAFLEETYASIPQAQINALLIQNQGDVTATCAALSQVIEKREHEARVLLEARRQAAHHEELKLEEEAKRARVEAARVAALEAERTAAAQSNERLQQEARDRQAAAAHEAEAMRIARMVEEKRLAKQAVEELKRRQAEREAALKQLPDLLEDKIRSRDGGPPPPLDAAARTPEVVAPGPVPQLHAPSSLSAASTAAQANANIPSGGPNEAVSDTQSAAAAASSSSSAFEEVKENAELTTLRAVHLRLALAEAQQVKLDWTMDSKDVTSSDWVGLFQASVPLTLETRISKAAVAADNTQPDQRDCLVYHWASTGVVVVDEDAAAASARKSLTIPVPSSFPCGWIQAHYYHHTGWRSYVLAGVSEKIYVGPRFTVQLLTDESKAPVVRQINVEVTLNDASLLDSVGNAWLALYEHSDALDADYTQFLWLTSNCTHVPESTKWAARFTASRCGSWEVRVFPFRSYHRAASLPVTLDGEDSVHMHVDVADPTRLHVAVSLSTANPLSSQVWLWVGFQSEKRTNYYRRFQYITALGASHLTFKTPIHKGTYEARVLVKGKEAPLCVSNTLDLPDAL